MILHVDFDYFFAQLEEVLNPSLKGKPIVVCVYSKRTEESGVVSTSNYIARKYGVKSGIPILLAKKKLESIDAVFFPVNLPFYERVSKRIMDFLRITADKFEQGSIDEAFLDVTEQVNGSFEEAFTLAESIKKTIFKREKLTCSIGIGPNKLIAKIASDFEKPDGLTLINPSQVTHFFSEIPIIKLPGVGRKARIVLESRGVYTIGDMAKFDVNELINLFGKKTGIYYHRASLGLDDTPVVEAQPKQISRIVTLKEDSRDFNTIKSIVKDLSRELYLITQKRGINFRSIGIILVTDHQKILTKSRTLHQQIENDKKMYIISADLVREILNKKFDDNIRRVGLKVFNLIESRQQASINHYFQFK